MMIDANLYVVELEIEITKHSDKETAQRIIAIVRKHSCETVFTMVYIYGTILRAMNHGADFKNATTIEEIYSICKEDELKRIFDSVGI